MCCQAGGADECLSAFSCGEKEGHERFACVVVMVLVGGVNGYGWSSR